MRKSSPNPRPTIPLVPELIDIRRQHDLTAGQADSNLFAGWGVRFNSRTW
ncbi:MAG: hypothetical protein M3N19_09810 [Candidatus Eremiobacteraeota bacterium]|nr:hypothetical protein [Candidatus Eremiobacteraeota bacterium]